MKKFLFLIISIIIFSPAFVFAGYDFYVDADADDGGDGSKENPFQTIGEALDEDGDDIFIEDGTYSDNIELGEGVTIVGDSKSGVVIDGKVTMKDGSEIKSLTVESGGVFVVDGADAGIFSVIIKNSNIGIKTEGRGDIEIKNTKIEKNNKGLYVQWGKDIDIRSSEIVNNNEEGIDIRANVDGVISDNVIQGNGESGIEVIAGGSTIIISKNLIRKNGSSGIATQYYSSADDLGKLNVKGNTISGNDNYGITCKIPSGGNPSPGYWNNSVILGANNISGNSKGDFDASCKFSQTFSSEVKKEEVEKKEEIKEPTSPLENESKEEQEEDVSNQKEDETKIQKNEKKEEVLTKKREINKSFLVFREAAREKQQEMEKVSGFKFFFVGPNESDLVELRKKIEDYEKFIEDLKKLRSETFDIQISSDISLEIEMINKEVNRIKIFILAQENKFNLRGWLFD